MSTTKEIKERQAEDKKLFLETLRKNPIAQVACEKTGTGRTTYYRWRKEDEQFKNEADLAITDGEMLVNDLSESQVISMIKERNFQAISLWLRVHHPKYSNKLDITAKLKTESVLTLEQEDLIREVLGLESGKDHA